MSTIAPASKYKRWPDLEAEIQRVSRLPQAHWLSELPDLHDETVAYLTMRTDKGMPQLFASLLQEVAKRTVAVAKRWARGLDKIQAEYIISQVEMEILELALSETNCLQREFLEYSFAKAVEHRTLNAVEKYRNSTMGKREEFVPESDGSDIGDLDEIERPIEFLNDGRPGQLATLLKIEDETLQQELVKTASAAVKDPRHLEAVILHHVEGWPISSKDPNKWTLERYFKAKPRTIKYWLKNALEAMQDAIGEKK
jgi:hypothetical protein